MTKTVKHKYPMIDLGRLLVQWTEKEWGAMLAKCEREADVEKLKSTLYGICRGMDELAKVKLNDERTVLAFLNLQRSIEVTMKRILRRKYPSRLDNPLLHNLNDVEPEKLRKELDNKRKRDVEFKNFLRDSRF